MSEKHSTEKNGKPLLLFNEILKYFEKYGQNDIYSAHSDTHLDLKEEDTIDSSANQLREEMFYELDNLTDLFGNKLHIRLKNLTYKEKENLRKFVDFYSKCPVCKGRNHSNNLKEYYIDEGKQKLVGDLVRFMNLSVKNKKLRKLNLNFGIPCCSCFEKYFK